MANAILGFPMTGDSTAAVFAGGSWVATLPLTNLQDDRLARVTRSTTASLANAQFTIDFGVAEWIRFVALVDHNFSRTSAVRVRGSNTAGDWTVTTYDSGWFDGWPVTSPLYVAPVGDASWLDGRMSAAEAADYNLSAIYIAASATAARYWKIEISDIGNTRRGPSVTPPCKPDAIKCTSLSPPRPWVRIATASTIVRYGPTRAPPGSIAGSNGEKPLRTTRSTDCWP